MRWIDICLPEPGVHHEYDALLTEAAYLISDIPDIQGREGLDGQPVVEQMVKVGQKLFKAIMSENPQAFNSDYGQSGTQIPDLGQKEHDKLVGWHLVVDAYHLGLPWTWLHSGLGFIWEKHPICVSTAKADQTISPNRSWAGRYHRAAFLVGEDGQSSLRSTLSQLRPMGTAPAEMLFVAGHSEDAIRRLIYREAEVIENALTSNSLSAPLASMDLPNKAITPTDLSEKGLWYQAIHFAGPTSMPADQSDTSGEFWMNRLLEDVAAPDEETLHDAMGMEEEVLGVDPITCLLDCVSEKYDREGPPADSVTSGRESQASAASGSAPPPSWNPGSRNAGSNPWLLDDGPVEPESLSKSGGIPPLIFSNSYRSLPELGGRFIQAGASTFIGPLVPLFSRPARLFAGHCYDAMGEGWCAAAAVWRASQACRQELGREHPAWLSYGIQGSGSLALQYL